jgi:hypothetical protein
MSRVPPQRLAFIAGTILVAAMSVGGCQGAPAAPELTDPRAILAAATTTAASAKSVRIDATADGTVTLDLLGVGTPSQIDLSGTTLSADLDLEGGDVRATFSAPNLLGLTGEAIVVDGTSYVKTSLTGPLYQSRPIGTDTPAPSGADRATVLEGFAEFLANPALDPVKGEDVTCGNTTCYSVNISLSPEDLQALGAGDLQAPAGLPIPVPIPDLSAATVDLSVHVAKDTTRLAGVEATIDLGGGAGSAAIDVTFSKWDEPVTISAPPADQVAPAS